MNNKDYINLNIASSRNSSLISSHEIMKALINMAKVNTTEENVQEIKKIFVKYNKGFTLTKEKKLNEASDALKIADIALNNSFSNDSFEYNYCQLFAMSTKSYFKLKINKKDDSISLTKKGIEYAIILQDYQNSFMMGLFISQMLVNLAKIYLYENDTKNWSNITLENIHYLSNFTLPKYAQSFNVLKLKTTPNHLRFSTLIWVINEALICVEKFDIVDNGNKLIESITIDNKIESILNQISCWIELNISISKKEDIHANLFRNKCYDFLGLESNKYNIERLKLFLINRIESISVPT